MRLVNGSTLRVRHSGLASSAAVGRVAVVGGGLAGLAAAALLAEDRRWDVTVFEKGEVFGGRAAETAGEGEHCTRLLLPDYHATRELLSGIPGADGHATVADAITRVRRMEWGPHGNWIELDHINRFRASGLSARDHWAIYRQRRQKPIVAAIHGSNQNTFGSWRQYSPASVVAMLRNAWQADRIFSFPGSTNHFLVAPLLAHLEALGVELRAGNAITRIDLTESREDVFDAVIIAAFPSDLAALLDASGVPHRLPRSLRHAHCKVLTIALDPRECVLATSLPRLYCRAGIAVLLQPHASRCVVLCTRAESTDDAYVLALVRRFLALEHEVGGVLTRANQAQGEAVWSATMPKASRVLRDRPAGIWLAGSWLASGYPYDSAESAIRSARLAVEGLSRAAGNRLARS
ncbi:FAD-dependent oxidoreductase [Amycolatopsis japonica]|uniref:FAD-dependent oxidoreductase n=1 Tax=Amycolatopsis japonica TaxID=208439 RepID=UPI003330465F